MLRVHPVHILSEEDRGVLDIWLAYRKDGMGGAGHLPFAGGSAEQPAGLMKALSEMDAADARISRKFKN